MTVTRTQRMCLSALAVIGREASSAEIRDALEAAGTTLMESSVDRALDRLARHDPSPVEKVRVPSGRRVRRLWALAGATQGRPFDERLPWAESRRLGRELRAARIASGITLREAAASVGMSATALGQKETATLRMTRGQAEAIAGALGVTLEDLGGGVIA